MQPGLRPERASVPPLHEDEPVEVEERVVESIELKARKNLIESKIYLKLGSIFKEVGLQKQATEKASS